MRIERIELARRADPEYCWKTAVFVWVINLAIVVLAYVAFSFIVGCGGPLPVPAKTPEVQRDLETFPVVEFIGDEMSQAIVTASQNSRYLCDDCIQGSDSPTVMAGLPAALAKHPDVVVILTGTIDITGDTFSATIGDQPNTNLQGCADSQNELCQNILSIVEQSQAAGAKVIVGTIPPFGAGPVEQDYLDMCSCDVGEEVQYNQGYFNAAVLDSFPVGNDFGVTVVDYASALQAVVQAGNANIGSYLINQYQPAYTDGGIDPNAAGTAVMENMINTAITALHVGRGADK